MIDNPVGDDAPASENLEIVEEVEPAASYGLRTLAVAVTDLILADDGIFGSAAPMRETTLQVVDRRNGYPITRVKGITLQGELNLAREKFKNTSRNSPPSGSSTNTPERTRPIPRAGIGCTPVPSATGNSPVQNSRRSV